MSSAVHCHSAMDYAGHFQVCLLLNYSVHCMVFIEEELELECYCV